MSVANKVNDEFESTHGGYRNVDINVIKRDLQNQLYPIAKSQHIFSGDYLEWSMYINNLTKEQLKEIQNELSKPNKEQRKRFQEQVASEICFSCFSKYPNLNNMFERYADKNRGISIGFDTHYMPDVGKVDYSNEPPSMPFLELGSDFISPDTENEIVRNILFTKSLESKDWRDEEEWRIVKRKKECINRDGAYFWNFPIEAIKEIYIAPQMLKCDKIAFSTLVHMQYPHIKLFETH